MSPSELKHITEIVNQKFTSLIGIIFENGVAFNISYNYEKHSIIIYYNLLHFKPHYRNLQSFERDLFVYIIHLRKLHGHFDYYIL